MRIVRTGAVASRLRRWRSKGGALQRAPLNVVVDVPKKVLDTWPGGSWKEAPKRKGKADDAE